MSPQTRAMQDDELTGPHVFTLAEGEGLWSRSEGRAGKSCADCHGDLKQAMKGVAARYPAFDAKLGRPLALEQRIVRCRTENQGAAAFAPESRELLALAAVVGRASPCSLYDQDLVTFEEGKVVYDHGDAAGFIRLNALRLRTLGQRRKRLKLER